MAFVLAVHSLRGGTGKTLISVNLSAFLVKLGYNVVLLDMDIGAPSLQTFIKNKPEKRINDYFMTGEDIGKILIDASELVGSQAKGNLKIGLANDRGNFLSKLDDMDREKALDELYKLMNLVNEILPNDPWNADFIILDTSPGFSKDSLNCVAAADHVILMLRLINADLFGTGELLKTLDVGLKPSTSLVINQVPSTFIDDGADEYTRELITKHIIEPVGSDRIKIGGFINNDLDIIEHEGEYAMYYLEGIQAQRPVHVINNPDGVLAKNIKNIAEYIMGLASRG